MVDLVSVLSEFDVTASTDCSSDYVTVTTGDPAQVAPLETSSLKISKLWVFSEKVCQYCEQLISFSIPTGWYVYQILR